MPQTHEPENLREEREIEGCETGKKASMHVSKQASSLARKETIKGPSKLVADGMGVPKSFDHWVLRVGESCRTLGPSGSTNSSPAMPSSMVRLNPWGKAKGPVLLVYELNVISLAQKSGEGRRISVGLV